MSETIVVHEDAPVRVPLAYWVVTAAGALWNALGATDYIMTRTRNQAWLAQAGDPAALLAWIAAMPL